MYITCIKVQCVCFCSVEPPSKKVCLSSPETIGDSEPMTVEEVSVDDSVTEEVQYVVCGLAA